MNPLFQVKQVGVCDKCKLYKGCQSPKMEYTGDGERKILVVAEAPGETEDIRGEQLIGEAGTLLRNHCWEMNLDLDTDCWKTNVIKCHIIGNKTPTNAQIKYCNPLLLNELDKLKPKKIFLFGGSAIRSFMLNRVPEDLGKVIEWIGWKIPDEPTGAWVYPMFHPSFILRIGGKGRYETIFHEQLQAAIEHDEPFPEFSKRNYTINYLSESDAIDFMDSLKRQTISIDYETTGLKPHKTGHRIVSMSISINAYTAHVFKVTKKMVKSIRRILNASDIGLTAQNLKFERMWSKVIFGTTGKKWMWDSMIASHLLNNQTKTGLKFQTYVNFGIPDYSLDVKKYLEGDFPNDFNQIDKTPEFKLLTYNAMDTIFERRLTLTQQPIIRTNKKLFKAYQLIHNSLPALSDTEINGFKINPEHYKRQYQILSAKIRDQKSKVLSTPEGKKWAAAYGAKLNFDSSQQVGKVLFTLCNYKSPFLTKTGKQSVDQAALEQLDIPFSQYLLALRQITKLRNSFLGQIQREQVDNYVHPFIGFSPVSWRSSVTNPSWQNLSSRDPLAVEVVKGGVIPRTGNRFLDSDYSTIEVHGAAWYTKDPQLLEYLWNPASDMHRDATMDCFKLDPDDVHKDARKCGKNSFVFPEFYGDYYVNCATHLWNDIEKHKLTTKKNVPLKQHLKKHGIKNYQHFEDHIREVEDYFWNERFKVYTQWKENTWNLYLEQGYLESFFGFKFSGSMEKNKSLNYQIQSTAFHCLLWAFTKLYRFIKDNKLKTWLIGETHDSMVKDVPPDEFDLILHTTKKIMVDDLIAQFPFIITPIEIEIEATDTDGAWHTKKLIETYRKEPKKCR